MWATRHNSSLILLRGFEEVIASMIELTNLRKEFDDLVAVENLTLSISNG